MLLQYRFRIRDEGDTTDVLTVDSVREGAIMAVPRGDGSSIDPFTGKVTIGSYNVEVDDENLTLVTGILADAAARQQLLNRRAFIEVREDLGAYAIMVGGWLTKIRLIDARTFGFSVGDMFTRPLSTPAHQEATTNFPNVTNFIGSPISGGFSDIKDEGVARFRCTVVTATRADLIYLSGPLGAGGETGGAGTPDIAGEPSNFVRVINRSQPYKRSTKTNADSVYTYPRMRYRLEIVTTGALFETYVPLARPVIWFQSTPDQGLRGFIMTHSGDIFLDLSGGETPPVVGTEYNVRLFPLDVSARNPMHFTGHPVDYCTAHLDDLGIPYNAASVTDMKELLGDLFIDLRFTESPGTVIEMMESQAMGPFGFGFRADDTGAVEFIRTRLKEDTAPSVTIVPTDLESPGTAFELDDTHSYSRVTWRSKRFSKWMGGDERQRPADNLIHVDDVINVRNADPGAVGEKELTYEVAGVTRGLTEADFDLEQYVTGIAWEVFDRGGRGSIGYEVSVLREKALQIGDEIYLDLPWVPNAVLGQSPVSQRGGLRAVQVTHATQEPWGTKAACLDMGNDAQPSVVPTFTMGQNANHPRTVADLTITNVAALQADGANEVRIEVGYDVEPTDHGKLLTVFDISTGSIIQSEPQATGTVVFARMRSESQDGRPGGWSAWQSIGLQAYVAPGAVAAVPVTGDGTRLDVTWTVNEPNAQIEIRWRKQGDIAYIIRRLQAGSDQYQITGLTPNGKYDGDVAYVDPLPATGVSTRSAWAVATTDPTTPSLTTPINPVAWGESGLFGMDVTAVETPVDMVLEVAVETAPGSGLFLSFRDEAIVRAVLQGWVSRVSSTAPWDGRLRRCRAYVRETGQTDSPPTASTDIDPWGTANPIPPL